MARIEQTGSPDTNYFVCTLGEAASIKSGNLLAYETINDFLDYQAQQLPGFPAVAFPIPSHDQAGSEEWESSVFTFDQLRIRSLQTAYDLSNSIKISCKNSGQESMGTTVALLCPSSVDFLFIWLGLMRLGYSVLLIAPQCRPPAILHLCQTCDVSALFYDGDYTELASMTSVEGVKSNYFLKLFKISDVNSPLDLGKSLSALALGAEQHRQVHESTVAYIRHTSGTSTGLPKTIPQSHRAAVGVLPCLDGSRKATWTTTPLYHGGVSDCFRAWTSGGLIWLFPGKEVPITAANVLKSFRCARSSALPAIKYFSSVPYVLQMVAAEEAGLEMLRQMDLVGVGGAALPREIGKDLVEQGVCLVSRYGNTECGFLLSSHRDYSADKEWDYLRRSSSFLKFEQNDSGLAELIILRDWPHMAKRNRDDGSYATADLFEAHSNIPDAWRYHSRADSQLTLITGKKFDSAPLEDAIAASNFVKDVLIFGNGQRYPGALLFRSETAVDMSPEKYLDEVWPRIEQLNSEGQGHTRLSRSMLIVMPNGAPALEKSSKGTVLRKQAEEIYKSEINQAYSGNLSEKDSGNHAQKVDVPDHDVALTVLNIVKDAMGTQANIPKDQDLFSFGVDSAACMQIRASLQNRLPAPDGAKLPLNVVYDCGTIDRLSKYVINIRKGAANPAQDEIKLMQDYVHQYGTFTEPADLSEEAKLPISRDSTLPDGPLILLTGATGSLGANILFEFLNSSSHSAFSVICLVRASSPDAALSRVNKSLSQRRKPELPHSQKSTCLPVKLSDPFLGLDPSTYSYLATHTRLIVHAAWAVNFSMHLRSFAKDHIAGLRHLINLALRSPHPTPPRFLFCSSTASVISSPSPIPERISHAPTTSSRLGYSRSKWVAEAICDQAFKHTKLHGNIAVLRIGQLCGDTKNGIWSITEAWPLMLSSVSVTGSLPILKNASLSWLPVDIAARSILEISQAPSLSVGEQNVDETPTFHILNPDTTAKWTHLLTWLSSTPSSPKEGFKTVPPDEWVQQLESLTGDAAKHPARKLLALWKDAYCTDGDDHSDRNKGEKGIEVASGIGNPATTKGEENHTVFAMETTKSLVTALRHVQPVGRDQVERIWTWLRGEMDQLNGF